MSNKITLSTIQFRADTHGVNPALDSLRQSSKDAHDQVDRLQEALNKGIKTIKDMNGLDMDVSVANLRKAKRAADDYDNSIKELMKGATALESVVKNISLGTIEKNSRAELKGAINAANSRLRSIKEMQESGVIDEESLQRQRELNIVILESQKQLNNLDRDTQKFLETIEKGEAISESALNKEIKGLKEMLSLIPKGTEDWNKYNDMLTKIEAHVAEMRKQEREAASQLLSSQNLGQFSEEDIRRAITNGKELLATYKTNSDEAKALSENIVRAEQFLKQYGMEAARQAQREQEQLQLEQELAKTMNKRLRDLKNLSADALAETQRYWQAQKNGAAEGTEEFNKAEAALKKIDGYMRSSRRDELKNILGSPENYSINEVKNAVQEVEKLRDSVQRGIPVWHQYNNLLTQGKTYLENLAKTEAAERIEKQMQNIDTLSTQGLQDVKKYWEAMVAGAKYGSDELDTYKQKMDKVVAQERERATKANERAVGLFASKDLGGYSENEIRAAIEAGKQLIQTYDTADPAAKKLAENIVRAEEHLKQYGVEAERAAQREKQALEEAARKRRETNAEMEIQLEKGAALTQTALRAQEQYWQRMIDDPKTASWELQRYQDNLQKVHQLQEEMALTQSKEQADKILGGRFGEMSEGELRAAITAAREYQQTLKTTDSTYKDLSKSILDAEEYLKKYGIEAERTARKEEEAAEKAKKALNERIDLMVDQWNKTNSTMSESALKAHERFWQQLIDDPKTAADSLDNYRKNLEVVQRVIQQRANAKMEAEGQAALGFFQRGTGNASANDIKQQADALKKWRDSLPQQTQADLIREIDGYLANVGKTAEDTTEEVMGLAEAMNVASNAGKTAMGMTERDKRDLEWLREEKKFIEEAMSYTTEGSDAWNNYKEHLNEVNDQLRRLPFSRTTEDLKAAQKALEDAIATTDKGTPKYDRLRMALSRIKAEMAGAGISAQKTQEVLANPKAEKNVDTLKNAVARARGELEVMGQRIERMQNLLKQAEANGNDKWAKRLKESIKQTTKEYDELAESTKRADQAQKELAATSKGTASAFEKAWSRLKTYITLYMGAAVAIQKLTATMGNLLELSDKMGEVRKTTGFSADEVGRISDSLRKLDVRTPMTQLMELSATAGQLGLKTEEDIVGFTEAANKMMIALPEMGNTAAQEMMRVAIATGEVDKIRKQLQEGIVEGSSATAVAMEKIASTVDRLRATSAATAPEITDFVKRVGAVGAQSGISIDQVAALGSTISSLGMRIEMSATALSRMIPSIQRNAFALANTIGVAPETIRNLFEAGRGMEVILMILQHIKDSGMDAESIEKMMGMGGMVDVMKELNQQGARAGIVFAGLSQNVDVLRAHLVTANQAYEENVAIQNEFERMNETAAAKWERLKNQIEEVFVNDSNQRFLGGIIEGLHKFIKLLTGGDGLSTALITIITLLSVLKLNIGAALWGAIAAGLTKVIDLFKNWRIALELVILKMKEMTAAQWANVFLAIAAAVAALIYKLQQMSERAAIVANEMAKLDAEVSKQTKTVEGLFRTVSKTNAELGNAKKRLEEVKKADEDTTEAENKLKKANTDHAASIREINSKYGQYLGYMLSETSSALQLAKARDLINAKLRETITLKQKEAALGTIEQEYGGKVNKKAASMERTLEVFYGKDYDTSAKVSVAITEAANKYSKDKAAFEKAVRKILADNKMTDVSDGYMETFENYRKSVEEYKKQEDVVNRRFEARANQARKDSREKAVAALNSIQKDWQDLVDKYRKAEGEEKEKLAAEVYKQQRSYANALANNAEYFDGDKRKEIFDKNIKNMQTYEKGLRSVAGEAIKTIDAMERAETKVTGTDYTNDGESNKNPWGERLSAESTDWKNMTAEQLVNRRKQMKEFVNAIQTDTDVQAVLKEDAALKKAIENGMSSDMRTVIEWYNTERLKIQDELHARHLTSTGDWLDPKKQKGAHKQFKAELDAYLEELDAYYTERKTEIEKARNEEEITEGEAWRRNLQNENEWYQRRAELMKLYGEKAAEVTEAEQDAIIKIIAERKGDSEQFVKAMIQKTIGFAKLIEKTGDKGAAMVHEWYAKLDLDTQKSFLKSQQAITKQVKFIEDTLAKERPYDGITKNMQDNLDKMGVLAAQMRRVNDDLVRQDKERKYSDAEITAEMYKEMSFYLRQVEDAYRMDVNKMLHRMEEDGMTETAKAISESDMLKQAVMGQLRKTYQEVQDAIKKEASQLKKNVDILWNDETLGPDGKSIKSTYDKVIAQLGMQQDSVSRANSLIGAGSASDNVASRIAIKQLQVQMDMQRAQFNMFRTQASQRMAALKAEAAEHGRIAEKMKQEGNMAEYQREILAKTTALRDADNVRRSLGLTLAEETKKEEELNAELLKQREEIQARLYKDLREWGDLLASSLKDVFEASNAGNAEYYNELAKLNLTGKGGPGAGTYVVIDNAGTEDATAHYEYLNERQALERQREIERRNAQAEAWKKVMDDINQKLSDTITDHLNAMFQNASIDANTQAVLANTQAIYDSMGVSSVDTGTAEDAKSMEEASADAANKQADARIEASNREKDAILANQQLVKKGEQQTSQQMVKTNKASFAAMTAAANMYGIAYQTMSNDNLDTTQKVQMMIVQAAGSAAITMLTASLAASQGETAANAPSWISKTLKELGPIGGPVAVGVFTALLGGLMGLAVSKIGKSKSEIAQVTGASVGAGRLSTGMLTYAEGNVNEFTDPNSLTTGRSYNVDAADGKTYRAKYTGKNPSTHITNGPEFHLVGEKGREAIIDANTTRLMQMDDVGIWKSIQTLYNGGSRGLSAVRRRGSGVRAFADGNLDDFEEIGSDVSTADGILGFDPAAMQSSLDRNSAVQEALLERLKEPIVAQNILYGPDGLPNILKKLAKEAERHGEKYL